MNAVPSATMPAEIELSSTLPESVLTGRRLRDARHAEWVLTNALGGFAMGTVSGTPERRYHGLLVGATAPPVGRVATLQALDETLVVESAGTLGCVGLTRHKLTQFKWGGTPEPETAFATGLERFCHQGTSVRWDYRPTGRRGGIRVSKELLLLDGQNSAVVRYRVRTPGRRAWLELRPLAAMRDFHELLSADGESSGGVAVSAPEAGRIDLFARGVRLALRVEGARFIEDKSWWRNFEYRRDLLRGQDGLEDLFCPGVFVVECGKDPRTPDPRGACIELRAWVNDSDEPGAFDEARAPKRRRIAALVRGVKGASRDEAAALVLASDQFVVRRGETARTPRTGGVSVIAGYPWFSDWGRDTCVSLPGLLLATRRFDEARATLDAFARLRRHGLIPNCFDNATGKAEYNTVDASLWYLQAACAYLEATEDRAGFGGEIRAACLDIVEAYRRGTDFGIRVDPADGLVCAGDVGTQLTWMDAKRDGIVFTPRHGKPVEVNALWCSGLSRLASAIEPEQPRTARELRQSAERAGASLRQKFWNSEERCLFDVLTPVSGGWEPSRQIRPNQIFAVSLMHSPLEESQRQGVLACVREHLLTPLGLRTLSPRDPAYRGRFEGDLMSRDGAYHNGTVWPWLIGAYAEAVLRVGQFSRTARSAARECLEPLLGELTGRHASAPSVLQLCEVYDGDSTPARPRKGDGCMAQAWSIAELLRVLVLLEAEDTPIR